MVVIGMGQQQEIDFPLAPLPQVRRDDVCSRVERRAFLFRWVMEYPADVNHARETVRLDDDGVTLPDVCLFPSLILTT